MTRRNFIQKLIGLLAMIVPGFRWFAKKASPRRFLRAEQCGKYPGVVKPLKDIFQQNEWSG